VHGDNEITIQIKADIIAAWISQNLGGAGQPQPIRFTPRISAALLRRRDGRLGAKMKKKLNRLAAQGRLKEGKIVLNNERWFNGHLSLYEDCPITLIVERKAKDRSKEQLGYLWGVVYPCISEYTGYSPEDLHELFKAKFLKNKMVWRGSDIFTVKSTQQLKSGEMAEFITNVIVEAADLGIEVPPPDKAYQFK